MNLSDINQGIVTHKKIKRVGRGIGSGHGKTAGRGSKGQYASAGARFRVSSLKVDKCPCSEESPKGVFPMDLGTKTFWS